MCTRATALMAISPESMDDDELHYEIGATERVIAGLYDRIVNLKVERRKRASDG